MVQIFSNGLSFCQGSPNGATCRAGQTSSPSRTQTQNAKTLAEIDSLRGFSVLGIKLRSGRISVKRETPTPMQALIFSFGSNRKGRVLQGTAGKKPQWSRASIGCHVAVRLKQLSGRQVNDVKAVASRFAGVENRLSRVEHLACRF